MGYVLCQRRVSGIGGFEGRIKGEAVEREGKTCGINEGFDFRSKVVFGVFGCCGGGEGDVELLGGGGADIG